jgi:pimeloyl-ACP methyl ester carboxylesterase
MRRAHGVMRAPPAKLVAFQARPGLCCGTREEARMVRRIALPAAAFVAAVFVAAVFVATAFAARAEQPWKVLPPMPDLPPATVSGRIHVNDIDMWHAEFGPANGKPLIMVHGGLANSNYFGKVIPFLVNDGFHVIVVDSRGHGRSTRSAQPYSYELMESDVVAMLDALHIPKADLVGWSDGGIIGIVMAIHHPEHLNRVFAFGANTVPDGLIPDFDKQGVFKQFELRARGEYRKLSPTPGQYDEFLKQISTMWATQPHIGEDQLKAIHTPIVIADGRYDEGIRQSHDRYMAAMIPNAHLVILPGVSHFAMLQNPPLFARAVLDAMDAPWDE